jgi:hypothetical protein
MHALRIQEAKFCDIIVFKATAKRRDMAKINEKGNEVPIIRKRSYKEYLTQSIYGGFIVGIMWFLISLIEKPVTSALLTGLFVWIGVIILFMGIGFPSEEYYKRKIRIKKLKSGKYSFLHEHSFHIHSDLFFEGTYKEYFIRVLPINKRQKKDIEYDVIEAYYSFDSENYEEKEKYLTGDYFWGKLYFSNHCVGFLPKDWENPNFKENLSGLISILKREDLKPLSKEEWENSFGKELKEQREKEVRSRTKQIIKIGKFDIKYIKNKNTDR